MIKFDFFYGLVLGVCTLFHTDNLRKTLKTPKLSVADGQNNAELTCKTLERIHTIFLRKEISLQQTLGISKPSLSQKWKAPNRLEVTGEGIFTQMKFRSILSRVHGDTRFGNKLC